jgi:hypothetical protein
MPKSDRQQDARVEMAAWAANDVQGGHRADGTGGPSRGQL